MILQEFLLCEEKVTPNQDENMEVGSIVYTDFTASYDVISSSDTNAQNYTYFQLKSLNMCILSVCVNLVIYNYYHQIPCYLQFVIENMWKYGFLYHKTICTI